MNASSVLLKGKKKAPKLKKKKSWKEKLHDNKDLPQVQPITEKMSKRWGTGTVVIPAPTEVDEIMRQIPGGIDKLKYFLGLEGNEIIQKGKKDVVKNFEQFLVQP